MRAKEVGRLLGEEWSEMHTLVQRARGDDPAAVLRPEAVEAVAEAKCRGAKLAILSNELDLFYGPEFRARLPLLGSFDCIVDCTYTGFLKPDAAAYRLVEQCLGLSGAECLLVDDQLRNVHGAWLVGWRAVHLNVKSPGRAFHDALGMLA